MDNLESIMRGHAEIMRTGLDHGKEIALGRVVDEINRMLDATGHSGLENIGFRKALVCVRAYIHAELRP